MLISNYNTVLQSNNTDLQAILNSINQITNEHNIEVDCSSNENAIISRTIKTYFNDRITNIGRNAFSGCSKLATVSFPRVKYIGDDAFARCSSLTTISFPVCTTIDRYAFDNCRSLASASFPVCTVINENAFYNCSSLTSVSFPACTIIRDNAFNDCYNLTMVSFPVCTYINYSVFDNCYNLKSLYLTGSSLCKLSHSNAFASTPIGGYSASAGTYGSIYVPASLLTSYQTATNWAYFSSRFVGINEIVNLNLKKEVYKNAKL